MLWQSVMVGVAVQFIRTALTGAVMNIYINTKSMKDREKAREVDNQAIGFLSEGVVLADNIYTNVLQRLNH